MELELATRSIGVLSTVYDGKLEQAVDSDITLPDYLPDILRILRVDVDPQIANVQAQKERVSIDGQARVTVLYASDNGTLQSFEQVYPFTRSADVPGLTDDAVVQASVKTEYANGRAVSQRRLDVHAMLTLAILARRLLKDEVVASAAGGGVQTLTESVPVSSLEALAAPTFVLTEVIEIPQDAPAIDQIIYRKAVAVPGDTKAIANKILLKGNLDTKVMYRSNGVPEPIAVLHTMPISQILEVPGVTEDTVNSLRLKVLNVDVTPKSDSNGNLRLLEITSKVAADVKGYQEVDVPVLVDAYSVDTGLDIGNREFQTIKLQENIKDTFSATANYDFTQGIGKLLLLTGSLQNPNSRISDGFLYIDGNIKVQLIFEDGDGNIAYGDKDLPYTYRRQLRQTPSGLEADVALELLSITSNISPDRIDVKAEIGVSADTYQTEKRSIVSSLTPDTTQTPAKRSPLTIYFAGKNEPLWDIARRYRTTIDAIAKENDLKSIITDEGQMLLIPSK
jgi:LysM repeat protein